MTHLVIAVQEFQEPPIAWLPWICVFVAGFIAGVTADLASLWLFAQWMQR